MAHKEYMTLALELARNCGEDVPVGCVIVRSENVIGYGNNRRVRGHSATAHAEIAAIQQACAALGSWRLDGCTLYVTLEPCVMCAGAIVSARIPLVVFGAYDRKAGAFGGLFDMNLLGLNHRPEVIGGVTEGECAKLLKNFFKDKR